MNDKIKAGGRLPDPGPDAVCGHPDCRRPRAEHGGPKKLGTCPGLATRFSIPIADRGRR